MKHYIVTFHVGVDAVDEEAAIKIAKDQLQIPSATYETDVLEDSPSPFSVWKAAQVVADGL